MFKEIKKINTDTNDVYFSNGKFVYRKLPNLYIIDNMLSEFTIHISDENFIIEDFNSNGIILRRADELVKIDKFNTLSFSQLPQKNILQNKSIYNGFIFWRVKSESDWSIGIWDIKKEIFLWEKAQENSILATISNDRILCADIDGEKLFCISLHTGEQYWEIFPHDLLNVSDANLFGDTEIYNNQAFVFASNFRKWGIFAIDIETGQVVNQSTTIGGWLELYKDNFYVAQDYLLKKLNPITFEVETFDLQSELEPYGMRVFGLSKRYLIKDNLFYFVSQTEGLNKVGVIDLETKKLLWQTTIQVEKAHFSILKLEVEENRLFILTQGGLLYIFERENMI